MRIVLAVLCALVPAVAAHADYSWELAGLFDHTEQNRDGNRTPAAEVDSDGISLSATRYFSPVEEGSGPLALAAFFDPRTQLSVTAGDGQIADEFFAGPNSLFHQQAEEDVSDYSLRGLYLFAESKWYAGGRYARHEGDRRRSFSSISGTGFGTGGERVEDYALLAGKYFGMGATRLEISFEQSTTESEISSTSCPLIGPCFSPFSSTAEFTVDTPRLAVMHVGRVRSATYALLGDVSEERFREGASDGTPIDDLDLDPPRTYFVGAELYPVPTIGVRLGYERLDSPGFEQDTVSVGASWFVRRNVGLELELSSEDTDISFSDDAPNSNRAALRVIGRL